MCQTDFYNYHRAWTKHSARLHGVQLDKTRKNGSNSSCNFDNVGHPIRIRPTQPKTRYTIKCHDGKKPCGIFLVKYLWPCELVEFRWSSSILSWSIAYLVSLIYAKWSETNGEIIWRCLYLNKRNNRAVARKKIWLRQCLWITYDWDNQSMVEFSS